MPWTTPCACGTCGRTHQLTGGCAGCRVHLCSWKMSAHARANVLPGTCPSNGLLLLHVRAPSNPSLVTHTSLHAHLHKDTSISSNACTHILLCMRAYTPIHNNLPLNAPRLAPMCVKVLMSHQHTFERLLLRCCLSPTCTHFNVRTSTKAQRHLPATRACTHLRTRKHTLA